MSTPEPLSPGNYHTPGTLDMLITITIDPDVPMPDEPVATDAIMGRQLHAMRPGDSVFIAGATDTTVSDITDFAARRGVVLVSHRFDVDPIYGTPGVRMWCAPNGTQPAFTGGRPTSMSSSDVAPISNTPTSTSTVDAETIGLDGTTWWRKIDNGECFAVPGGTPGKKVRLLTRSAKRITRQDFEQWDQEFGI